MDKKLENAERIKKLKLRRDSLVEEFRRWSMRLSDLEDQISDVEGDIRATGDVYSSDVHLNNEAHTANEVDGTHGSWTIQEGSDDLFLMNRNISLNIL